MYQRVIEMVRHYGLDTDPLVRNELANLLIHSKVAGYNNQRAMDKIKAGQLPGPEMSIAKLAGTLNSLRLCDFVSDVLGAEARRRHRRVGHLRVEPADPRHAGRPHRRRHRRGDAQHRRRARARPAQGSRHRQRLAVQGPQGRHAEELNAPVGSVARHCARHGAHSAPSGTLIRTRRTTSGPSRTAGRSCPASCRRSSPRCTSTIDAAGDESV